MKRASVISVNDTVSKTVARPLAPDVHVELADRPSWHPAAVIARFSLVAAISTDSASRLSVSSRFLVMAAS